MESTGFVTTGCRTRCQSLLRCQLGSRDSRRRPGSLLEGVRERRCFPSGRSRSPRHGARPLLSHPDDRCPAWRIRRALGGYASQNVSHRRTAARVVALLVQRGAKRSAVELPHLQAQFGNLLANACRTRRARLRVHKHRRLAAGTICYARVRRTAMSSQAGFGLNQSAGWPGFAGQHRCNSQA